MKNALIIFSRTPVIGKCKTRLAKMIGPAMALEVYEHLLSNCARVTKDLKMDKFVFYSEQINSQDVWDNAFFFKSNQEGTSLGDRMENAFISLFNKGYQRIVIIGTDIPDLNSKHILKAFDALRNHDYVIGPSIDGGYYLLGMKSINHCLFRNKKWGESTVLEETILNIKNQNLHLLEKLNDIDTFEDLKQHKTLFELFKPSIKHEIP